MVGIQKSMPKNILIAGGGTGGHLFPALAIGEEIQLKYPKTNIHYIGSTFGLEAKVFPIKDVWHTLIPIRGYQRDFSLKSVGKNLFLPFRIIESIFKLKTIFDEFSPNIVIGTGGYASALPIYLASRKTQNIRIILQEQNSYPGVTNRWFSQRAEKVCIAFQDTDKVLNKNTYLTGNPVRKNITNGIVEEGLSEFNLSKKHKVIFVFGGSQGSAYLNKMINSITSRIESSGIQILWQTGDREFIKYRNKVSKKVQIVPFVHNMANAYAISDLIISRSGALTLSEITVCGKAAILIPFSNAAGDHQTKNANVLVNSGAARLLNERTINADDLFYSIMNLIHNKKQLEKMGIASKKLGRPNATEKIVDYIMESAN